MTAVLVSDLTIVNGFFVWPKMLAAAFLLAAAALVLTPLWSDVRRSVAGAGLVAALIGLSLLSHAASLFGVIPLMLWGARNGLPRWRWMAAGLLVGMMLLLPWSAYQQYGDPPGNRLTKWMLGGTDVVGRRGALQVIRAAYRRAGWQRTVHNKLANFSTMAGSEAVVSWGGGALKDLRSGDAIKSIYDVRAMSFFFLLPQLGLLLLGPVAMAIGYRRRTRYPEEWSFAVTAGAMFLLGCLCWGLLMFGSEDTRAVIHTGSLAVIVLGMCGAISGLRATFPRVAVVIVVTRILFALALYVPSFVPAPGLPLLTQVLAVSSDRRGRLSGDICSRREHAGYSSRTSPRRVATLTASVRLVTPSFSNRCPRWVFTVRSLMSSAVAISLFALPSASSFSVAISRGVSCTRVTPSASLAAAAGAR